MQVDHHDLAQEFPEFKDEIHKLKISSAHFARLYDEYERVEHEIHLIEVEDSPVSDAYLEDLKKKRLQLKDEIYLLLRGGGVPAQH